jgi:hypothetical protein
MQFNHNVRESGLVDIESEIYLPARVRGVKAAVWTTYGKQ